jgi:hypothetical protein
MSVFSLGLGVLKQRAKNRIATLRIEAPAGAEQAKNDSTMGESSAGQRDVFAGSWVVIRRFRSWFSGLARDDSIPPKSHRAEE